MSDGVAPSKGAMKAAFDILSGFGKVHSHWQNSCATVIDRETKSPQMVELLREAERVFVLIGKFTGGDLTIVEHWREKYERLLSELEVKP